MSYATVNPLNDQLAELLYDAQHDNCDDECIGGGMLWYERVAKRLTDPNGPLAEVGNEREMQNDKWGEQNHPDGTGLEHDRLMADSSRRACKAAANDGTVTWRHILVEEFYEAMAEADPSNLRTELIQIAAVAVAWVEAIDRRRTA